MFIYRFSINHFVWIVKGRMNTIQSHAPYTHTNIFIHNERKHRAYNANSWIAHKWGQCVGRKTWKNLKRCIWIWSENLRFEICITIKYFGWASICFRFFFIHSSPPLSLVRCLAIARASNLPRTHKKKADEEDKKQRKEPFPYSRQPLELIVQPCVQHSEWWEKYV